MNKSILEYSKQELDLLYETLSMVNGKDRKSKQEMQKRRFRELILPLGREGNAEQKSWAKEKLLEEGKDFIRFFIEKYYRSYCAKYGQDLEHEGLLWLCQYGMKYDPDKGTFSTFLTLNLKGVMHKFINAQVNHVSAHYGAKMDHVRKAQAQLEKVTSDYSIEDLAARTGYPVSAVKMILKLIQCNKLLYLDGDESGIINTLVSDMPSPEEIVLKQEMNDTLIRALENLPPKCRDVLNARFSPEHYFSDYQNAPINRPPGFKAIAKSLGMTPTQVRGCYRQAIMQLQKDPGLIAISES